MASEKSPDANREEMKLECARLRVEIEVLRNRHESVKLISRRMFEAASDMNCTGDALRQRVREIYADFWKIIPRPPTRFDALLAEAEKNGARVGNPADFHSSGDEEGDKN